MSQDNSQNLPRMTTDKTPDQTNWITLHEAFNRVGRAIFGRAWRENCARLGPARLWLELDFEPLEVPEWDDPEATEEQNRLVREGIIELATPEEVRCFENATAALYEALWHGDVKSMGRREDGTEESVPREAWLDKTGKFQISIGDSEAVRKAGASRHTWVVEIDASSLGTVIQKLDRARIRELRQEAAKKGPRGGAPQKYKWGEIERRIIERRKTTPPPKSKAALAREIEAALLSDGWEKTSIPDRDHISKRILELEKNQSIPKLYHRKKATITHQ